jgi:hypothetical protein
VGRFFLSLQSEAKEKTDHRETKRKDEGRGGRTERRAGQVPNRLIVWRAALLSRRAVPKRSGVGTLADGSGEKTRGQAQPRSCFCLAESGNWNGKKTGWSGTGTKTDRNQHTMGTLGVSEAGEAWDWRLTDSQSVVRSSTNLNPRPLGYEHVNQFTAR